MLTANPRNKSDKQSDAKDHKRRSNWDCHSTRLANSSLVPKIHVSSAYAASDAVSFQRIAGNAREAGDLSISKEIEPDGGIFVREQKIANNLSNEATEIIMASWRPGQRCQTIHAIELGGISFGDTCRIVIPSLLKQSRSGHHLKPMEFKPYSHNDKLCVVENMKQYIKVTKNIRKKEE
eukprot:Seg1341.6 transcript_id=Seg1341.6/GoldUCD/mRNA.D3Y31 product="hypothetical protein" protein_id=Seg1341.6/GoldUCD/D3Y31